LKRLAVEEFKKSEFVLAIAVNKIRIQGGKKNNETNKN
jgi:hypothetical protein